MLSLCNDVIDLSALSVGQLELQWEPVDPNALLAQALSDLEGMRGDRPVHLRLDVEDALPVVRGTASACCRC